MSWRSRPPSSNSGAAGQYLAYNQFGEITSTAISAGDIDRPTVTYGVVRVPDGNGIKVNNGVFRSTTQSTQAFGRHRFDLVGCQWPNHGSRAYAEGDLPYAASDVAGVMKVSTGLRTSAGSVVSVNTNDISFAVPMSRSLRHRDAYDQQRSGGRFSGCFKGQTLPSGPTFSTTKISYDSNGLIIGGTFLETGDIPPLDFEQIVAGVLQGDRINDKSIPRRALSDFCITFVQEASSLDIAYSVGTFWYKESTKILRVFTGTRWHKLEQAVARARPSGVGRLHRCLYRSHQPNHQHWSEPRRFRGWCLPPPPLTASPAIT